MRTHLDLQWQKSSFCGSSACIEIATADQSRLMRDSKDKNSPILAFDAVAWGSFIAGVKADRLGSR
ncbi:DUF397 domain-containing protein [Catenuloplanes indicus]|uniref:DUF397 domain-containing protein n=1 Tax=Catenuloplanes indicus TaxID=137267 RepID=A0AAE4AWM4_9ACTN|nr:DUF397 domain-containing protein [Catenuloplanes indicus]MDQ0366105.1 hypothetical protein [Catenuloplanes indicus]